MKKHPILYTVTICAASIALTLAVGLILLAERFGGMEGLRTSLYTAQTRGLIQSVFVGETELSALTDGALRGMVDALDDPWSYYMTADEYEAYQAYSENQYSGVGITVQAEENAAGLRIVRVAPDSPAAEAGIAEGTLLLAVNGEGMQGKTAAQAREAILSAEDGRVRLLLQTEAGEETECTVTLGTVKTEVVFSELKDGGVGYIRIENFESGAADEAITALNKLRAEGAKSVVFDVRANPGGRLAELTKLLDTLLPDGEIFVSRAKDGTEEVIRSDAECVRMPMAVLVDENSYSAAEYFAAVLSEYGWAETVGAQTTGKARSQITLRLPTGGALHISTSSYLTPNRVDLSLTGGFTPKYPVEQTADTDMQLAAALDLLRE